VSESARRLRISESFVSIQGEGPSNGEPAAFLRLAGCNLTCVWCDTKYSWDWATYSRSDVTRIATVSELVSELRALIPQSVKLLVLTGGEPLLQQLALIDALSALRDHRPDVRFEVETNGTVAPRPELGALIEKFVVSPKLENAGRKNSSHVAQVAVWASQGAVLKFVVRSEADVVQAGAVALAAGFNCDRVWVMPEGDDEKSFARHASLIVPKAIELGLRVSPRLHLSIWGDKRGR
jgi:7-carboxy-7-deazaguanine synthase